MAKEIERRFLVDVKNVPDLSGCLRRDIVQGYFNTAIDSGVVRVRTVNDIIGYQTIKFKDEFATNDEFEYEIPVEDARYIISKLPWKIEKTRFIFPFLASDNITILKFEVDFFDRDICIAEVEVPDINTQFHIPDWVEKEITSMKGVSNFDMAKDFAAVKAALQCKISSMLE